MHAAGCSATPLERSKPKPKSPVPLRPGSDSSTNEQERDVARKAIVLPRRGSFAGPARTCRSRSRSQQKSLSPSSTSVTDNLRLAACGLRSGDRGNWAAFARSKGRRAGGSLGRGGPCWGRAGGMRINQARRCASSDVFEEMQRALRLARMPQPPFATPAAACEGPAIQPQEDTVTVDSTLQASAIVTTKVETEAPASGERAGEEGGPRGESREQRGCLQERE